MDDPLAWETTATDIDYSCPGFDIRRDDVRLPDGTETDYHYVDEPPAVVILPFTPDGDVVLIEEWRQAVGRVNRGLPAGGTEPDDDDLAAAAERELAEETGYEADELIHLTTAEPANGIANSVHHYFVARGCEPTAEQELDFNESIRVDVADYDDLLAAVVDSGTGEDVVDGRTAIAVLNYELTQR
ncbi:ADP-ribose pyrophosphatase [Halogranum gelatinilyticum]|uniref:ADP-ribose pyrophosphatase n=1 Tax=Halogranum gelatinilyticum TaxID=660521 RepID=A0A1G9U1I5_9EURY|nr:NUDIX hydrolase [Halogranum gelatinilyticum]SDM53683.1 ADP-ribose pyrophosphatase [Halogranum gelatinilyticum]